LLVAAAGSAAVYAHLRQRQMQRQLELERVIPRTPYLARVQRDLAAANAVQRSGGGGFVVAESPEATLRVQCGLVSNRVRIVASFPWVEDPLTGGHVQDPDRIHHLMPVPPEAVASMEASVALLPPVSIFSSSAHVGAPATPLEQQLRWREQLHREQVDYIDACMARRVVEGVGAFGVRTWTDQSADVAGWSFL